MQINSFKEKNNIFKLLKEKDENERTISIFIFSNVSLSGRNMFYPNVLLYDTDSHILYSPYDEKIMSLNKDCFYDNNIYDITISNNANKKQVFESVFFLIYNFDNYYHFLYDTLPYLYSYLNIKQMIPSLKLLINYPNKHKKDFYKFNIELLNKFINIDDIIIHQNDNVYSNVYVSTSLTHGGFSNLPPRKEVYELYKNIKHKINLIPNNKNKYIYISRRTWINKDISNIGTDYTSRRKMMNEDLLVDKLTNMGIQEIFTENLTTDEKIQLFNQSEMIIGSIGGGMSNLLFSNTNTKSIVIVTPYFLDVNYRFKYSMEHTNITYFNNVITYTEDNDIPLYCRVQIISGMHKDKIGEIVEYNKNMDKYVVNISNNDVAGFNNQHIFDKNEFDKNEFKLLDSGLNSPYIVDIDSLINLIYEKKV
jgi:capsular polysaccharide biosynthesis protein